MGSLGIELYKDSRCILGGSWVVISGVISGVTVLITHIQGLITLLITTHEPPSTGVRVQGSGCQAL